MLLLKREVTFLAREMPNFMKSANTFLSYGKMKAKINDSVGTVNASAEEIVSIVWLSSRGEIGVEK